MNWEFLLSQVIVPLVSAAVGAGAAFAGAYWAVSRSLYRESHYAKQTDAFVEIAGKADEVIDAFQRYIYSHSTDLPPLDDQEVMSQDKVIAAQIRATNAYRRFERTHRKLVIFLPQDVEQRVFEFSTSCRKMHDQLVQEGVSTNDALENLYFHYVYPLEHAYLNIINTMRRRAGTDLLSEDVGRQLGKPRGIDMTVRRRSSG